MDKKKMTKLMLFTYFETRALKEYLEAMALEGWILKEWKLFLTFEKGEPQKLTYSVEVLDKGSASDFALYNNSTEFIDLCESAGWEFVCSFRKMYIFITENENNVAIETDVRQKFRSIYKSSMKDHLPLWILWMIIFFNEYLLQFQANFDISITSYISIFSFFFFLFLNVVGMSSAVLFFVWVIKAKKQIALAKSLPGVSLRMIQIRQTVLNVISAVLLTGYLALLFYSIIMHDLFVIGFSSFLLTLLCIIQLASGKITHSQKTRRIFGITAALSAALLIVTIGTSLVGFFLRPLNEQFVEILHNGRPQVRILKNDTIPLTLEDMGVEIQRYRNKESNTLKSTIFASTINYRDSTFDLDGNETELYYSIFSSDYRAILDQSVKSQFNSMPWKENDPSPYHAEQYFAFYDRGRFFKAVFVYPDRVLTFTTSGSLDDFSFQNIYEKLVLSKEL